jgi:hypothetical protein
MGFPDCDRITAIEPSHIPYKYWLVLWVMKWEVKKQSIYNSFLAEIPET